MGNETSSAQNNDNSNNTSNIHNDNSNNTSNTHNDNSNMNETSSNTDKEKEMKILTQKMFLKYKCVIPDGFKELENHCCDGTSTHIKSTETPFS